MSAVAGTRTGGAGSYYVKGVGGGGSNNTFDLALSRTIPAGVQIHVSLWTYDTLNSSDVTFRTQDNEILFSPSTVGGNNWVEHTFSVTLTGEMSEFQFRKSGGNAGNSDFRVDDVKIEVRGLIDDPYYQPALATGDRLGRMSRRLLGITPVPALGTSQVVISQTLTWDGSNHTAQSLTGGQAFEAGFVPTMISLVPSAASSGDGWTIGTSADADQYKTVASYSTGKTIYTQADFASRVPGGTGATNLDLLIDPDTANYTGSIEVTIYGSNTAGSP